MIRHAPGPGRRRRANTFRPSVQSLEPRRLMSAFLLKDVNTTPPFEQVPAPAGFFEAGGALLFAGPGAPGAPDRMLWKTDGTPAGTAPLHPVVYGNFPPSTSPGITVGNVAFFGGTTPEGGTELWKTDGTAAGTVLVKDVFPGAAGSHPAQMTNVGGTLYFTARDPDHGREVWKSDGTSEGTVRVSETLPGPQNRSIREIAAADGVVYFSSHGDSTEPGILWKTDGTPAGTTAVAEFRAGTGAPNDLEALGSRLVFNGYDPVHATEPWVSDGTPEGTRMLKDIRAASGSSNYSLAKGYFRFDNAVYFSAYTDATAAELWKTDGTPEGTVLVEDLSPAPANSDPRNFVEMNGAMYFLASAPSGAFGATTLWRSDGTADGTVPVKEMPAATSMVRSGDTLFVATGSGDVWKSDGTEAGSALVRDFSYPVYSLTAYRGGAAFQANSGGWEPWFTDGTTAGTVMLADLDRRTVGSVPMSRTPTPVSLGNKVLFTGSVAGTSTSPALSETLWVTDGTTAGTARLSDVYGVHGLTRAGGGAYFFAAAFQNVRQLWYTDGTPGGTRRVLDKNFIHGDPVAVGDALYFGGDVYSPGSLEPVGLYRSDGTEAGTKLVKATSNSGAGIPENITVVGDEIYFTSSYSGGWGFDLWRSDGTEAGTVLVKQFTGGNGDHQPMGLGSVGGKVFMRTHRGNGPSELWTSDGTPHGTLSLGLFGFVNGAPVDWPVVAFNGEAYFAASPATTPADVELWKSDGTPGGTTRVADINPGAGAASFPRGLTVFNGRLYFSASDPAAGTELWSTDGTGAGTSRLLDLRPGVSGSTPTLWREIAGRLYFTANDGPRGFEMWSTDGTAAGTSIVHDVHPTSPSAGVRAMTPVPLSNNVAGDRVIFWADDGVHGTEPWSAPRPDRPANDFVVGRHVFYNNSRFDDRTPGAARADDGAIAPDKRALLPGGAAGFEHLTGYTRGLNGVMIDLNTRLPLSDGPRLSFRVGAGTPASPWAPAPAPSSITRRNDGLPEDVDRVTVVWPDGAIRNTWLEVTVETWAGDAVVGRDVFYFGHLTGETGDPTAPGAVARVTAADLSRTRAAMYRRSATPSSAFDHNRDGAVNVLDFAAVRGNLFASLPVPATSAPATLAAASAPGPARRHRPGLWAGTAP